MQVTPEELLRHADWLRELARSLSAGDELADELVQDTWLAAVRKPPRRDAKLRAWLATVLRRQQVSRWRREERRARHEAAQAPAAPAPATDELVSKLQLQRALVDALLALGEPYCAVVTMRYFDGMTPRAIAAQRACPVATVNSQLARGLRKLRAILDRRFGDRSSWSGLLPLIAHPRVGVASITPTSFLHAVLWIVTSKAVFSFVVVAALALWGLRHFAGGSAATPGLTPAPRSTDARLRAKARATPPRSGSEDRAMARHAVDSDPRAARTASGEDGENAGAARLRGRVVNLRAAPLVGVHVRASDVDDEGASRAQSDASGFFDVAVARGESIVATEDPRFVTIFAAVAPERDTKRGGGAGEALLVAAPARAFVVRVRNAEGAPISGASVFALYASMATRVAAALDRCRALEVSAETDAAGRAQFEAIAAVDGLDLLVEKSGYASARARVDARSASSADLVLAARKRSPCVVRGVVLAKGGAALAGAHVLAPFAKAHSDREGRFVLRLAEMPEGPFEVTALHPGKLPARRRLEAKDFVENEAKVELRVERDALALRGVVVDEDHEPIEGVRVSVGPLARFVTDDGLVSALEHFLSGSLEHDPMALFGVHSHVEMTDAHGRFALRGLLDRSYTLRFVVPESLLSETVDNVRAGTRDLRVTLPLGDVAARVDARVVDRRARPVPDAVVAIVTSEMATSAGAPRTERSRRPVRSDRAGRVRLERLPERGVFLRVSGAGILAARIPVEALGSHGLLRVDRRADLRVTLSPELAATATHAVIFGPVAGATSSADAGAGATARAVQRTIDGERRSFKRIAIRHGASATYAVPATATRVEIFAGERRVRRAALALRPGELTHVRL